MLISALMQHADHVQYVIPTAFLHAVTHNTYKLIATTESG